MTQYKSIDLARFRHLYPFRSRFMRIRGRRYHYLDEGAGRPVLMLHGNPTWSFYYRELVRGLVPDGFRALVPDHIGCGLSESPPPDAYGYRLSDRVADLENFIDRVVPAGKIDLVLHDWGGMIGMAWAVLRPERIRRIVVLNTAAFHPPTGKPIPFRLRLIRNVPAVGVPAVLGLNLFAASALVMATARGLSPAVRAGLIAPYNNWNNRIATLRFVQDIPLDPKDPSYALVDRTDRRLDRLSGRPMLILWGEKDFVFDADYLAEWRRRFPRAEVERFPEAGHYVLEDAPERIVARVRAFLARKNAGALKGEDR